MKFDPLVHIKNAQFAVVDGEWPSFNNAEIHRLDFWKGDMRPDDGVYISQQLVIDFEINIFDKPDSVSFFLKLKFKDCDEIDFYSENPDSMMSNLKMEFKERGKYSDGSPYPQYIAVETLNPFGLSLKFLCFEIEVIEKLVL